MYIIILCTPEWSLKNIAHTLVNNSKERLWIEELEMISLWHTMLLHILQPLYQLLPPEQYCKITWRHTHIAACWVQYLPVIITCSNTRACISWKGVQIILSKPQSYQSRIARRRGARYCCSHSNTGEPCNWDGSSCIRIRVTEQSTGQSCWG